MTSELRTGLRQLAAQAGRSPQDVRVLPGLSLYLASTRAKAQDLFEQAHTHLGRPQRLAKLASILGVTVDGLPSDRRLGPEDFAAPSQAVRSRTHAELLLRRIASDRPTLDALLALPEVVSSAHWQVIGTPDDAVEQILAWRAADAIDGCIALPGGSLGSLALFLDQVVSTLQTAGALKTAYHDAGLGKQSGQEWLLAGA